VRFLVDEMFPPAVCAPLSQLGHDALHVRQGGVNARPDPEVAALARHDRRVLVTENVKDFVHEQDVVVVCVLKSPLKQKGMAEHLARTLDEWARTHPAPYQGLHWPAVTPHRR
jgi:Domain of unknown function (DUF5615)